MKHKLAYATLQPIDKTLNQNERLVAFPARTFNNAEQKHSSAEKEAYAAFKAL